MKGSKEGKRDSHDTDPSELILNPVRRLPGTDRKPHSYTDRRSNFDCS